VTEQTIEDTPVYLAGLDRGDDILSVDGVAMSSRSRLDDIVQRHRPGDAIRMLIRRRGTTRELTITIAEDPRLQFVPAEQLGRQLTAAERAFRDAWLSSRQ